MRGESGFFTSLSIASRFFISVLTVSVFHILYVVFILSVNLSVMLAMVVNKQFLSDMLHDKYIYFAFQQCIWIALSAALALRI